MRREAGTTLVESLVACALVVVLATLAAPSFGDLRRDARRLTRLEALVHGLALARVEAVTRGQPVVLCRSLDGHQCDSSGMDWRQGWLVIEKRLSRDPRGRPLSATGAEPAVAIRANRVAFEFAPSGLSGTTGTLVLCDDRGARAARAVIVSRTGRPRTSTVDADGRALTCP